MKSAVIADLVVADSQLLAHFEISDYNGLTVKFAENKPLVLIAVKNFNPHPFIFAGMFVSKFDFNMIAAVIWFGLLK